VAALLRPQKIAGATQFQIESGNFEPGTEIGEFFERCQPAARDRSQFGIRRNQKVSIGAAIGAAYASAQLIKL
jgi:hypothetical protein